MRATTPTLAARRRWVPRAAAALACAAAASSACSNDFEKQSHISRLRVLAVAAEPAELILSPDGGPLPAANFTALAIEPNGAPIATDWSLCTAQGALPSPDTACPGDAGIAIPATGPATTRFDLNDPRYAQVAVLFAQGFDGGSGDGGDGGLAAALATGIPVLIGFDATAPANFLPDGGPPGVDGGQLLSGFTTINLRSYAANRPVNRNPAVTALQAGGVDIAADGSTSIHVNQTVTLQPVPAADAKEPTSTGGVEKLTYSFYSTAGDLSALRSTDTTATGEPGTTSVDWTAPADPGPARFWLVVRDDRGGVGWLVRDVTVIP